MLEIDFLEIGGYENPRALGIEEEEVDEGEQQEARAAVNALEEAMSVFRSRGWGRVLNVLSAKVKAARDELASDKTDSMEAVIKARTKVTVITELMDLPTLIEANLESARNTLSNLEASDEEPDTDRGEFIG